MATGMPDAVGEGITDKSWKEVKKDCLGKGLRLLVAAVKMAFERDMYRGRG